MHNNREHTKCFKEIEDFRLDDQYGQALTQEPLPQEL